MGKERDHSCDQKHQSSDSRFETIRTATSRRSVLKSLGGIRAFAATDESADDIKRSNDSRGTESEGEFVVTSRRSVMKSVSGIGATRVIGESDPALTQTHSGSGWHSYHFDTHNTGYNPSATGPKTGVEEKWRHEQPTGSAPIIAGDTVYTAVSSAIGGAYGGSSIRAFNRETGQERWTFTPENSGAYFRTPTYADGTIYLVSHEGAVYAVSADSGEKLWQYTFPVSGRFNYFSSATILNGSVYFRVTRRDSPATVYALDRSDGTEIWQTDTITSGGSTEIVSAPPIDQGTIYLGSIALDADSGAIQWENSDYNIVSSTSVTSNTVVSGLGAKVVAFDKDTGEQRWEFDEHASIDYTTSKGTPAIAGSTAYYGRTLTSEEGTGDVVALDVETGEQEWRFESAGEIQASPTIADSVVYVGDRTGTLYALDRETGAEMWRFTDDGGNSFNSYSAVVDGTLFVYTDGGFLYTLEDRKETASISQQSGQSTQTPTDSDSENFFLFEQFANETALSLGVAGAGVIGGLAIGMYRLLSEDAKTDGDEA